MNRPRRMAIFISGGGTTMQEALIAIREGRLQNVVPALIVSSRKDAGGIAKAIAAGIDPENIIVLRRQDFRDTETFGEAIIQACEERGVDLIFQCGWLTKTPSNVIERFAGCIFNQHPGALDTGHLGFGGDGMFGMRVHYVALQFAKFTGRMTTEATVHRVTENYDEGAVVRCMPIPILKFERGDAPLDHVAPA